MRLLEFTGSQQHEYGVEEGRTACAILRRLTNVELARVDDLAAISSSSCQREFVDPPGGASRCAESGNRSPRRQYGSTAGERQISTPQLSVAGTSLQTPYVLPASLVQYAFPERRDGTDRRRASARGSSSMLALRSTSTRHNESERLKALLVAQMAQGRRHDSCALG